MRQRIWVGIAGAIVLAATGCSSDSPSPTASSPAPSPVKVAQKPTASQSFSQPTVNQKLPPPPNAIPGLIQSTNGDERAKQVQAGIQATKAQRDPFKSVPPAISSTSLASAPRLSTPALPPVSAPAAPPRPSSPFPGNSGVSPGSLPKTPASPSIATLPPLPSTNLANAVEVTGVVQVGGISQAIVKSPNEPASRYVRTGQRLANGQVLVKRIEVYRGSANPVVILEENGIEVAKAVGDPATKIAKPV